MSEPVASLKPLTHNFTLLVASLAANALLIIVPIVVARGLGPDEYGAYAALSSFFTIAAVGSTTLQFMASQIATESTAAFQSGQAGHLLVAFSSVVAPSIFFGLILIGAASGILKAFLRLESAGPVFVMAIALASHAFLSLARGILQGIRWFFVLGSTLVLEAFLRLAFVAIFVYNGWGISGAFLAYILAMLPTCAVVLYHLRGTYTPFSGGSVMPEGLRQRLLVMLAMQVALTILANSDIPAARYFFPGPEAGHYAATAFIGRGIIFAGAPIVWVMFSLVSYQYFQGQRYNRILQASAGTIFSLAFIPLMLSLIAPDWLLYVLFGTLYRGLGTLMAVYVLNGVLVLLVTLLSMFRLGLLKNDALIPLGVGILILWSALFVFHRSPRELAISLFATLALVFIYLLIQNWKHICLR